MFCPNCGKEQAGGAKFCIACGQKLPIIEKENHSSENEWKFEGNASSAAPQSSTPVPFSGEVPAQRATPAQYPAQVPAQTAVPSQYPAQAPTQAAVPPQYPAPSYAPAQMPSPSPVVAGAAKAASKVGSGVKWTIILSAIAAIAVLLVALFYKTDEQKIEDRIEAFNIACSNSDLQGMFDCFDKYTRTMYSTTIGLTEGIIGGLTGFDLPLGDMLNLFAMESAGAEGMGLELEIESIEVNENSAIVTLTAECAENIGQETIVMCKEGDDWFIDLRATEAAVSSSEDSVTD